LRDSTKGGCDGESDGADQEDAPASVQVSHRTAQQEKRAERKEIAVDDPLESGEPDAELVPDRGQGHVNGGSVQEHHPRSEDGCGQREPAFARTVPELGQAFALPCFATASAAFRTSSGSPRYRCPSGRRSRSSSYTRGTLVGMLSPTISSSEMESRCLTSARRLFPCATIKMRLPERMEGAISSFQIGRKRATTSFKHSVAGISSAESEA